MAGMPGLVWGFLAPTVLLFQTTFLVNSMAHGWEPRRYDTKDDSRNNWWIALVTFGEGWHNNHHRYPSSARQGSSGGSSTSPGCCSARSRGRESCGTCSFRRGRCSSARPPRDAADVASEAIEVSSSGVATMRPHPTMDIGRSPLVNSATRVKTASASIGGSNRRSQNRKPPRGGDQQRRIHVRRGGRHLEASGVSSAKP
jgi:hypothetical protein